MIRKVASVLALLVALVGFARVVRDEVWTGEPNRAADALPLYLSGAAVAQGLDPTQQTSLSQVYDEREMTVAAATFSTLYPATAGSLMRWVSPLTWGSFARAWRWILLGAIAAYGLAAAIRVDGDRWARLGWGGAVAAALVWHPVSPEALRLGQVNVILGALCALALALTARQKAGAAVLLAVGALVKLVPGALAIPLLATRRWRPVGVMGVLGVLGIATVLPVVTLPRFVEAVFETLRFQSHIDPDWLVGRSPAPGWMRTLGWIRHDGLQWITLGAAALVPALRPSAGTAAAGMALLCAWLGADAAGFHVLYLPLAWPVWTWAAGRPAHFAVVVVGSFAATLLPDLTPEPRMVVAGFVAWGVALAGLLQEARKVAPAPVEADPEVRQGALALAGVACGALLMGSIPGDGPLAAPLPEGQATPEGAGFIHAGDRVPGQRRSLGAGIDRPASTLARPGTIRGLQFYLRRAPGLWRELGAAYPAREAFFEARASAAPTGELRDLSGRQVRAWLVEEQAARDKLVSEGLDVGEVGRALEGALASGLADPDLEARIPEVQQGQ